MVPLPLPQVVRLREMLTSHLRWKRAIEPCVLAGVYITGCMLLPLFFPCTPAECHIDAHGQMKCTTGLPGAEPPSPLPCPACAPPGRRLAYAHSCCKWRLQLCSPTAAVFVHAHLVG